MTLEQKVGASMPMDLPVLNSRTSFDEKPSTDAFRLPDPEGICFGIFSGSAF